MIRVDEHTYRYEVRTDGAFDVVRIGGGAFVLDATITNAIERDIARRILKGAGH